MTARRAAAIIMILGALTGWSTVAAPLGHADPLGNIKNAVNKDRAAAHCPPLTYNPALEGAAQTYARSENIADSKPPGYIGYVYPALGSGDPQAAAITSAYQRGAGDEITSCRETEFGVGFVRHDDRSVDVVTIVLATPGTPPKPPVNIGTPIPAPDDPAPHAPAPVPPGADTPPQPGEPVPAPTPASHTVTGDVDLYDKPGGDGKIIGELNSGDAVTLNGPCPMKNPNNPEDATNGWCQVTDTTKNLTGAVWGDFISK